MNPFSKKDFLQLALPTEDDPVSDQKQIENALQALESPSPWVFSRICPGKSISF